MDSHAALSHAVITDTQPAITVESVTKVYPRHFHDARSLKEILTFRRARHRAPHSPLTALRDISFEVRPHEMVGIIGANGAGKSTMLKVLAGITPPTSGRVHCRGRIGSLLELGAGFQPDLSGMENIYLSASVMGVTRGTVDAALDAIIDFAGLRPFIHTPVKHYSSGMYVRLGFSIAIHLEPDLLLVDEVLSVGDTAFQVASFRRLVELRERGVAAVLVSHDLHAVEALCDRLLWLDHGEARAWGSTGEILNDYRAFIQGQGDLPELRGSAGKLVLLIPEGRVGTGEVRIEAVRILGPDGQQTQTLRPGQPMTIELNCLAQREILDADVMITAEHESLKVTMISAQHHGFTPIFPAGRSTVRIHFPRCLFSIGAYQLTTALVRRDDLFAFYDHHVRLHRFSVITPAPAGANPLLSLPLEFDLRVETR
ncbi:ABC transporter ATP-binding protein [Candidatus Sumerlaeota bacterium]|nr:ABC transporter ATP-binding protein [Candidatus Sumerlaeota bacterium]